MSYSDDAFPDAEQLFRRAFDHPHAPSELLKLIRKYPSYDTIVDLLVCYSCVAEENPESADALAATLAAVGYAPDAPLINGKPVIEDIFCEKLTDLHSLGFQDASKPFGPSNPYLIGSLLSGLSFKYNLLACSYQYGPLVDGFNVDPTSPNAEVLVTGSCIQLLIAGSAIVSMAGSYTKSLDEASTMLKAQRKAGTMKNVNALKVLELTITHAENGFKKENDISNAWQLLFPTNA